MISLLTFLLFFQSEFNFPTCVHSDIFSTGCFSQLNDQLIDSPSDATILSNHPYVLSCLPHTPPPLMVWVKDGLQMEPGFAGDPRIQITYNTTSGLTTYSISSVEYSDAGQYQCQALNEVMTIYSSEIATISVTGLPVFTSTLAPQSLTVGSDIFLTCVATANPLCTITWAFNGQTISSEGQYSIVPGASQGLVTDSVLQISNLQVSNTGFVTCTANNTFGKNSTTAKLTVTGKIPNYPNCLVMIFSTSSTSNCYYY